MRVGCTGCLGLLVACLLLVATVGGSAWLFARVTWEPEDGPATGTAADAERAEQKIFEVVRTARDRGRGSAEPIAVSEPELNALIARRVEDMVDSSLEGLGLRLGPDGMVELYARVPLRRVAADSSLSCVTGLLPTGWLARSVTLRLRGPVSVEASEGRPRRRTLRIETQEFWIGRQRVPTFLARFVLDPAVLQLLRWRLPRGVEAIAVEPGWAVIYPTSSR